MNLLKVAPNERDHLLWGKGILLKSVSCQIEVRREGHRERKGVKGSQMWYKISQISQDY